MAFGIGLEPITYWLTANCSAIEPAERMVQDEGLEPPLPRI